MWRLVSEGRALYEHNGCSGCHSRGAEAPTVRAPPLEGLFGHPVPLQGGQVVSADATYLHDSIVTPNKQLVAGYAAQMPSYEGQLSEDDILKLVAYIESLAGVDANE